MYYLLVLQHSRSDYGEVSKQIDHIPFPKNNLVVKFVYIITNGSSAPPLQDEEWLGDINLQKYNIPPDPVDRQCVSLT